MARSIICFLFLAGGRQSGCLTFTKPDGPGPPDSPFKMTRVSAFWQEMAQRRDPPLVVGKAVAVQRVPAVSSGAGIVSLVPGDGHAPTCSGVDCGTHFPARSLSLHDVEKRISSLFEPDNGLSFGVVELPLVAAYFSPQHSLRDTDWVFVAVLMHVLYMSRFHVF